MGFGVWEGLQSVGNGCGIQVDEFSAHTEPYGSIFMDFHFTAGAPRYQVLRALTRVSFLSLFLIVNVYFSLFSFFVLGFSIFLCQITEQNKSEKLYSQDISLERLHKY